MSDYVPQQGDKIRVSYEVEVSDILCRFPGQGIENRGDVSNYKVELIERAKPAPGTVMRHKETGQVIVLRDNGSDDWSWPWITISAMRDGERSAFQGDQVLNDPNWVKIGFIPEVER